ncbi:MurR/RpiR family transcriptional regulator [Zooshikella harenae]|uniref:MurR/RpiR family transcriptional regulator n=1 Tax=Zooshikella harenae TaxID=2827238 RepID=A0ABS5ZB11_9GAMM|nr:MurR/RpiR family transcriptional regulator [Zooshikella harenae]MBU2711175.1 MurR/RpiR family transcriptional regulator [Zooshikella harenae]
MTSIPPETLAELEAEITARHKTLSKRLRQVAHFMIERPKEVAFGTVAIIARDADVPPSTLVRFANAFGFQGFSDMQKLFRAKLVEETPSYNERVRLARKHSQTSQHTSPMELLEEFTTSNMVAMEQLIKEVNTNDLEKAVSIIYCAQATHIVGFRRSFVVACYFAYALRHIDQRAFLIDGVGGLYREQATTLSKNDALIAISFKPYATETQDTIMSKPNGVPLIVITDSQLSPLTQYADVCFVVKEAEVRSFRSLTASLCLAQTIAIGLAYRVEEELNGSSQ